jgi:hypothetical protein
MLAPSTSSARVNVVIVTGGEMLEQGFEGEQCTKRGWEGREGGREAAGGGQECVRLHLVFLQWQA